MYDYLMWFGEQDSAMLNFASYCPSVVENVVDSGPL
jgi:hypothetical protein